MSCMYEYNQNPDGKGGFILGQITSIKSPVGGCAAGSVWEDDQSGRVHLASRTAESLGSVWRKVPHPTSPRPSPNLLPPTSPNTRVCDARVLEWIEDKGRRTLRVCVRARIRECVCRRMVRSESGSRTRGGACDV
jgi:hypothetical protein